MLLSIGLAADLTGLYDFFKGVGSTEIQPTTVIDNSEKLENTGNILDSVIVMGDNNEVEVITLEEALDNIPEAEKLYYLFVLDANARMSLTFGDEGETKWSSVQDNVLARLRRRLPSNANYGLITAGGDLSSSPQECGDNVDLAIPLETKNQHFVADTVEGMNPQGSASLADAISKASDVLLNLPSDVGKTLFIIVGGGDNCYDEDEWEEVLQALNDLYSLGSINVRAKLVILVDEEVEQSVIDAFQDGVERLGNEDVAAEVVTNSRELKQVVDDYTEEEINYARTIEPTAVAAFETVVHEFPEETAQPAPVAQVTQPPPTLWPEPTITNVAPATPTPQPTKTNAPTKETPTNTATSLATLATTQAEITPTFTPTSTPSPIITSIPTPTETPTKVPVNTPMPTNTISPTQTPVPATLTPTNALTQAPPTATPVCQVNRSQLPNTGGFGGTVAINAPGQCTTGIEAESAVNMAGIYSGISQDAKIWVLAFPPNELYYPQSPNACAGEPPSFGDGSWQVTIFLGAKEGAGTPSPPEWFDVVVIQTDEATSQFLSSHVQAGCQAGSYTGLTVSDLSQWSITEMDFITVQTQN